MQVGAQRRVGGEEADVRIDLRRRGVVVPGPDVHVASQPALLAAHDQGRLGVGLDLDQTVHHADAGLFELVRPLDVPLLVESRFELDEDEDFLPALDGPRQRVDDPRASPGPVQRQLDRRHVRVVCRLDQQPLHRRLERVVRVVDQDVVLGEGREDGLPGRERCPTPMWRVVELGERQTRDLPQGREVEPAVHFVHILGAERSARSSLVKQQLPQQQLPHGFGHDPVYLDPDDGAVRSALGLLLDDLEQAHGVQLIELQVRAAGHAERVGSLDPMRRVDQAEVLADHVLHRYEPAAVGERQEPRQRVRHLQVGEVQRPGAEVAHHHGQRQAQVGDHRKGMAGRPRERLRRDDGEDLLCEVAAQALPLRLGELGPAQDLHAVGGELRQARDPQAAGLALDEPADPDRDRVEQLLGRQPLSAGLGDGRGLPQRRDADHEELVQVRAQNGQEPHPREQRHGGVFRQGEHAAVELEQAEVAVEKMLGPRQGGTDERRAETDVGEADPPRAGARLCRRVRRDRRPLAEHLRARGHGERGEGARVAQARRAGSGEHLLQGQPPKPLAHAPPARSGPAPGQPNLQRRAQARARRRPEESHLAVGAPESRPQDFPTSVLAAAAPHRQAQLGVVREQGHAALLKHDHGDLPAAPRGAHQRVALQLAEQPLRAVYLAHQERAQPVALLERPADVVQAGPSRGELPDLQLLERPRQLVTAHRHHVVDEIVARPPPPARPGPPHAALGLELDAGDEARGVDQRL